MDMPSKLRYLPIALLIFLHHAAIADANPELIGHYSGSYETTNINGNAVRVGVELTITSVEGNRVTGKVVRNSRNLCQGEYPMEGQIRKGELRMKATKRGGALGDCSFRIRVTPEGSKLVGTTNAGKPLYLSK